MAATKTASKKATSKKATAKKATAKKAAAGQTARKTTTKKGAARKSGTQRATTARPPRLLERDPKGLLEDVGYATAGVVNDAVDFARELPGRLEGWRDAAKDAPERVLDLRTEVPTRVERTVKDVRVRVSKDLTGLLDGVERRLEDKAAEGRRIAESWRTDERVQRVLTQTDTTRSQIKGAVTSLVRTGTAAAEAGRQQAGTATSQAKGAVTSLRKSGKVATEAAREQADTATSQVKGAATSTRRTARTAAEAARETTDQAS